VSTDATRPAPERFLSLIRQQQRGRLKIYLGFAAGVGKTYEMLQEGHRLRRQGVDVVLAIVETHGRAETAALVEGLEQVPRRRIEYRGVVLEEMDLDAVLARRPTIALVDETSKQTELLLDARDNAERLLARINTLLDLARLEQKREPLDLRPESPSALLEAVAESIRPRAADKGVELATDAPADMPSVFVDAARLRLALDNLLDNAVTYTERGGRITLSASAEDGRVTLTVADTGRGIPPEYLPHVFDKFFRVPGQSEAGGTGLGLAIAQEIVNAHGGNIHCDSRLGAGTVFRVKLPTDGKRVGDAPRNIV
jgi:K+-sensing histidine kinase KdpD